MERAATFYETVFDVKLEEMISPTDYDLQMKTFAASMVTNGINGALVKMANSKAGGSSTLVYFGSLDCTTEEQRIEKAGGKIHQAKMSIGQHGFITMFSAPEGNMIGLHSME